MTELYNIGPTESNIYAHTQKDLEGFRERISVDMAHGVSSQTLISDLHPKFSEFFLLFQVNIKKAWAFFSSPPNFFSQRPSSAYAADSLGGPAKQLVDIQKLESFLQQLADKDPATKESVSAVIALLQELQLSNTDVDTVQARIHQFTRG